MVLGSPIEGRPGPPHRGRHEAKGPASCAGQGLPTSRRAWKARPSRRSHGPSAPIGVGQDLEALACQGLRVEAGAPRDRACPEPKAKGKAFALADAGVGSGEVPIAVSSLYSEPALAHAGALGKGAVFANKNKEACVQLDPRTGTSPAGSPTDLAEKTPEIIGYILFFIPR